MRRVTTCALKRRHTPHRGHYRRSTPRRTRRRRLYQERGKCWEERLAATVRTHLPILAWVPQPDFERTVLKAHDRSSAAATRVGRAHGSYIQEMLKKSPDDAALQKPGHFGKHIFASTWVGFGRSWRWPLRSRSGLGHATRHRKQLGPRPGARP